MQKSNHKVDTNLHKRTVPHGRFDLYLPIKQKTLDCTGEVFIGKSIHALTKVTNIWKTMISMSFLCRLYWFATTYDIKMEIT